MKLDPLLQPLAELAPEWAKWYCVGYNGVGWAQSDRGWPNDRGYWEPSAHWKAFPDHDAQQFKAGVMLAINLRTGAIHIQQPDSTIVEVPQSEWSGMP